MQKIQSVKDNYGKLISYLARYGKRGRDAKQAIGATASGRSNAEITKDIRLWLLKKT
jgi:hypothetical protein